MELRIGKCTAIIIKRAILSRSEDIHLPNDNVMKNIKDVQRHKYLGVLEAER